MKPQVDISGLSPKQQKIATTLDEPLFVEAGAGSGKTFTLTQRIAWALAPGSGEDGKPFLDDLSRALVITFTNVAAREIKERVRATLRKSGMMEHALEVDSAWISTIHGMCKRILVRHALDLGIDPAFTVASGNETDQYLHEALIEVAGEARKREGEDPALKALFDEYGFGERMDSGKFTGVQGLLLDIRDAAIAAPGGFDDLWVPEAADIAEAMGDFYNAYGSLDVKEDLSEGSFKKVMRTLGRLEEFNSMAPGERTPERALETLSQVEWPGSSPKYRDKLVCARDEMHRVQAEIALARTRGMAETLLELARKVDERYFEKKKEHALFDNDDLVTLALRALQENDEVRKAYAGHFRLVMVDEFQDTDKKQLALIKLLSGEGARHLATVGDSQQSIYRFRGADVTVFHERGEELPETEKVQLATNYRSHKDILSFVDAVCGGDRGILEHFMHLDPAEKHKGTYETPDIPRIDIEISAGTFRTKKMQSAVGAAMIAKRFRAMADAGANPGDMVLLLRNMTNAEFYIDAIRKEGLSCVVSGGSGFTKTVEAETMQALLHFLANDRDTESGLFPLLSSDVFGIPADDFVQLATTTQPKSDLPTKRSIEAGLATMQFRPDYEPSVRLVRAHDVLVRARQIARRKNIADACAYVVKESGWLSRLVRGGAQGKAAAANVLAAIRYVRGLSQDLSLGSSRTAFEFDRWLQVAKIAPAALSGGEQGAVRIMTIHSSKGAEFKIVAVAECWGDSQGEPFCSGDTKDGRRAVIVPPKGFSHAIPEDVPEHPKTLAEWYERLKYDNAEADYKESTRLLYVALTRAKEAIILGLNPIQKKKELGTRLAAGVVGALFDGTVPDPGTHRMDYGGTEPALVHVARISETEEAGQKVKTLDAGGILGDIEGVLPSEPSNLFATDGPDDATFDLFEEEEDALCATTYMRASREGIFSYSSAHGKMAEMAEVPDFEGEGRPKRGGHVLPTRAERDAMEEGAPVVADADKATNLGSAFHLLAQGMIETGKPADAKQIEAQERAWRLGPRGCTRLEEALSRWSGSSARKEALAHGHVQAEVPFFARTHKEELGEYAEGAFDLLAWDSRDEAYLVDYKTGDVGLSAEEIFQRHFLQADLYARILMDEGFAKVSCHFVCVELEDADHPGEPFVVTYDYDAEHAPTLW
ncbi:MAG: UvrD-helicase domain-containing protein [Atopobiaceae bacterium]